MHITVRRNTNLKEFDFLIQGKSSQLIELCQNFQWLATGFDKKTSNIPDIEEKPTENNAKARDFTHKL